MNEEFISPVLVDKIEVSDDILKVYADGVLIDKIPGTGVLPTPNKLWRDEVTICGRYDDNRHIDGELVPMLCTQCGGRLDPDTLCCKFCGTYYKIRK